MHKRVQSHITAAHYRDRAGVGVHTSRMRGLADREGSMNERSKPTFFETESV